MGTKIKMIHALDRRIWKQPGGDEAHWIWCGSLSTQSVPQLRAEDGKSYMHARKVILGREGVPIPLGRFILPMCGEARCVRPEHMAGSDRLPRVASRRDTAQAVREPSERRLAIVAMHNEGVEAVRAIRKAHNLTAIAEKFGISRERVRQIIAFELGSTKAIRMAVNEPEPVETA